MRPPIKLGIPMPCHESWSTMQPAGKGRYCTACQKTVVDFTAMTDAEIVRHLSRSGPKVCGRLAPDQLHRNLAMQPPPKRNGWSGWRYLLAGVLITSNKQQYDGPSGKELQEQRMPSKADNLEGITLGEVNMSTDVDTARTNPVVVEKDVMEMGTVGMIIGDIAIKPEDFAFGLAAEDSIQEPPLLPLIDSVDEPLEAWGIVGGLEVTQRRGIDSVKHFVADTLETLNFPSKDSIKQWLMDSLAKLSILPGKPLTIYPNPAPRGSVVHLSWRTDPGTYQVALTTISGALIGKRVIYINNRAQEDTWEIPGGMAAGVYVIRAMQPGQNGGYTAKLVVL